MKKKLIIVLTLFSLLAAVGGGSLIFVIGRTADTFDTLIQLHEVEILREHLLLNVYQAQDDLNSQTTPHPESWDGVFHHVSEVNNAVSTCFSCHHVPDVLVRLQDLQGQIDDYSHALSRVLTLQAKETRFRREQERAHLIGESLISKINTMIVLTNRKLNKRTEESLDNLQTTKMIVILLVIGGPLLVALLSFSAARSITRPIQTLQAATKKLKAGNLGYRITGLRDEFGELALAFNEMAGALLENMSAIQQSEKRYRLLFESAGDAIFILEAEGEHAGKIVQANHAASRMHGYSVEELLTMNIRDMDTPDAALGIPIRMERLAAGERIQTEITHRKKDGTVFPVEISAALFEVADQKYILAIDRDITERKQAEQEIQRAQRIKVSGELATGLAHEIKNPLAGIMLSIEALSEEACLEDEDRDLLQKVIKEIKRIELLINSLLNFARPPRPHFQRTNANSLLETVSSLVLQDGTRSRKPEHPIRVVREFDGALPEIMADPMQLQQILMNLLLNALEAMPQGGALKMKTAHDAETGSISIELSDTGPGVDEAVLERVFQPFFTTKAKGTGLGLAITRRLVEEHGGTISVRNNPGGGASFIIRFPVARVKEEERREG